MTYKIDIIFDDLNEEYRNYFHFYSRVKPRKQTLTESGTKENFGN